MVTGGDHAAEGWVARRSGASLTLSTRRGGEERGFEDDPDLRYAPVRLEKRFC
jgi:hypothetical protein